jgi:hypothetical protein
VSSNSEGSLDFATTGVSEELRGDLDPAADSRAGVLGVLRCDGLVLSTLSRAALRGMNSSDTSWRRLYSLRLLLLAALLLLPVEPMGAAGALLGSSAEQLFACAEMLGNRA